MIKELQTVKIDKYGILSRVSSLSCHKSENKESKVSDQHIWGQVNPVKRKAESKKDLELYKNAFSLVRKTQYQENIQHVKMVLSIDEINENYDGQVLYGVNDLFIGQKTHVSARYQLCLGKEMEQQSSSGIIVSTGLGSTGWLKSIMTGASSVVATFTKNNVSMINTGSFDWVADYLYYTVREPYPSKSNSANLVSDRINRGTDLKLFRRCRRMVLFSVTELKAIFCSLIQV